MRTMMFSGKLIAALLLTTAVTIAIARSTERIKTAGLARPAYASEGPRVIEIKAKRFEFSPSEITLKKGQPVILRLTTEDRTHGFLLKALKVDTDIPPGKTTDVPVTPQVAGNYTVICDHYCGIGHGNMKMTLTVIE